MLPIEQIPSSTTQSLMIYISIVAILILVATIVRLKVEFLKKAFIPASLLAGIMGMILGPHMLKVIPADIMSSIGGLSGNMIVIVFAVMLLGVPKSNKSLKSQAKTLVPGVLQFYIHDFFQIGLVCIITALIFTPLFGTNPIFGSTFEIGFLGGHGTAGGMVTVFEELNWADGGDVAKTTATIGLLSGIFGGMALINFGVRKRYTKHLTVKADGNKAKEVFADNRPIGSSQTISNDVVETFAFHFGLIGISILIGWVIVWSSKTFLSFSIPLFPFAMIGGWLVNMVVQRTSLKDLVDRNVLLRIQGFALEILVTSAVASISIPVVFTYWKELLIGSIIVVAVTIWVFLWLSPRIFQNNWFEHGIMRYGAASGVAAVAYLLMRTCDPEMKSDAGSMYALSSTFMSPYIGGGLLTSAYPLIIVSWGVLNVGLFFTALSVVLILFLRFAGFWIKNPKLEQRSELANE
jgi:ESS family glutamate:Na+ symporter